MTYCDRCDRCFSSWNALKQHQNASSHHNICDDCDIDFTTWEKLENHWINSLRHSYCRHCEEHFDDDDDLEEHYDDEHHWCQSCNRIFNSEAGLNDHYRKSSSHHYCDDCDRHFNNANSLRNHLQSSVHRSKSVPCRGHRCNQTFVSVSAMLLHLEAGTCVSGVDRRIVDTTVRKWDRKNLITDPKRMLTGSSSSSSTTYYATSAAWNGYQYECYLCHSTFSTLTGLNQHLASPKHQQKVYVCPQATCRTKFKTLSGLCQHVESESCGVHRFREVKRAMDVIVGKMGLLTM